MTSNLVVTCESDNYHTLLIPRKTTFGFRESHWRAETIGKLEMVNVIAEQLFQYSCAAPNGFPWSPQSGSLSLDACYSAGYYGNDGVLVVMVMKWQFGGPVSLIKEVHSLRPIFLSFLKT